MPTDRSPLLVVAAAFLVATTLFCLRVHRQPLQPYGSNAAEYIEHAVRLEVADIAAAGGSPAAVLFAADDAVLTHPPGLHLLTLPAQRLLGREAEAIVWTGLGWHLLLALALGLCAAALGPGVGAEPHDGLRTRRFAAGLTTGLLFPAGLAASTRYHYDLPMTALLWCGVAALLLGRDRAPARAPSPSAGSSPSPRSCPADGANSRPDSEPRSPSPSPGASRWRGSWPAASAPSRPA
jgi:hypothetical protein